MVDIKQNENLEQPENKVQVIQGNTDIIIIKQLEVINKTLNQILIILLEKERVKNNGR